MSSVPPIPVGPRANDAQVLAVSTDVAAFIGHTSTAASNGRSLSLAPTRIDSLKQYEQFFGGPPATGTPYLLYDSVTLFFANGGARCVVVSVGTYSDAITRQSLVSGLVPLVSIPDVSIVVMPETVRLSEQDSAEAQRALLAHCGESTRNRFAILDIRNGNLPLQPASPVAAFVNSLGTANRSFGAAYYPWLVAVPARMNGASIALPPGGAMAGVFASVDNTRGVWKAPANVALSGVTAPAVAVTEREQDELKTPLGGVAVNAIRTFPGIGTLVWGARTLDSNSLDWRYISVRRTALMIEESIRLALQQFAFEPNDSATWAMVRASVEDFLTTLWRAGGLPGSTVREAFAVRIGVGETMTQQDVSDGRLVLELLIALIRPAEFTVITFEQQVAE